ncbi:lactate utilization protein C [Gleimia sp. 6138-11-ORH1]|uniref:LutC/YkgG family protein n=1 Tax=Gleimia sp. 6138-11-ORH1 TaxID=2973937 RepID=UPI00216787C8|nr:lactate utilization protein C [Gleimia sp. 6138-11-ORH1]MCS4485047.1 lactate utilization protein C [Gleimia sp. 6138-11-ORH1]
MSTRSVKDLQAKAEILRRVRFALAQSEITEVEVPRDYISSSEHAPGSAPVLDVFEDALNDYKATVWRTDSAGIAKTMRQALDGCASVVVPAGLDADWLTELADLSVRVDEFEAQLSHEELDQTDAVITASRCSVSHTGTIILDGEPDQGRRAITLVPDRHVVVVKADTVYPTVPQAVAVLQENPTRPTTWIAGPSATSDIELIRVDGVHGPRNLQVILVVD